MNSRWHVFEDLTQAAHACNLEMTAKLLQELAVADTASLALSGGSSPKALFQQLANTPIPWARVHIFWVDERCVPPSDVQSNFCLADELLLKPAQVPSASIHRICGELPPADAASRYTQELRQHFRLAEGEFPEFTVVHQGIGPDGHTASLFPGEPLIDDRTGLAAAVYVEKLQSHRVTLLPGVLLRAKSTVFLANGADKVDPLYEVLQGVPNTHQYPAQLFAREAPSVNWFLDQASARRLPES